MPASSSHAALNILDRSFLLNLQREDEECNGCCPCLPPRDEAISISCSAAKKKRAKKDQSWQGQASAALSRLCGPPFNEWPRQRARSRPWSASEQPPRREQSTYFSSRNGTHQVDRPTMDNAHDVAETPPASSTGEVAIPLWRGRGPRGAVKGMLSGAWIRYHRNHCSGTGNGRHHSWLWANSSSKWHQPRDPSPSTGRRTPLS